MRKNEPTAEKRVAGPISFSDLDGQLKKNLTFDNGSAEVFTYRYSTNDWVAAAFDTTELGGANQTGIYMLQLSQAETNYDVIVGVKLVKAGYADQFWFEKIDNTADVNVLTITNDAITAAAIANNAIDASAIADDALTAAKFATDSITDDAIANSAVTEIQAGLATGADLAIIYGIVFDIGIASAVIMGLLHRNAVIDNQTWSGTIMTAARLRVFADETAAAAAVTGAADGADGETQRFLISTTVALGKPNRYQLLVDL